jgi:hypothetical protein
MLSSLFLFIIFLLSLVLSLLISLLKRERTRMLSHILFSLVLSCLPVSQPLISHPYLSPCSPLFSSVVLSSPLLSSFQRFKELLLKASAHDDGRSTGSYWYNHSEKLGRGALGRGVRGEKKEEKKQIAAVTHGQGREEGSTLTFTPTLTLPK